MKELINLLALVDESESELIALAKGKHESTTFVSDCLKLWNIKTEQKWQQKR